MLHHGLLAGSVRFGGPEIQRLWSDERSVPEKGQTRAEIHVQRNIVRVPQGGIEVIWVSRGPKGRDDVILMDVA